MKYKRLLIFGEAITLAHVVRPYVLAKHLVEQGYDVHFASARRFEFVFDEPRIVHHWVASKSHDAFLKIAETGKPLYQGKELIEYVYDELKLIDTIQPDVVMGDFRHSLAISASLKSIPYINLINAYWRSDYAKSLLPVPELRQFSLSRLSLSQKMMPLLTRLVFKIQGRPLNQARKHFGLPANAHCLDGWTGGDMTLYYDFPEAFAGTSLNANEQYIGHVPWQPKCSKAESWSEAIGNAPYIYVALGSSGGAGIRDNVIDHLISAGYTLCVSGVQPEARPRHWPKRVLSAAFLPGSEVAKGAALVMTNGGSPTTYQALATGTPVIGIPANMDQLLCMRKVQELGAGYTIRPWQVDRPVFLDCVQQLMSGGCREAARRWATQAQQTDYKTVLADVLNRDISSVMPSSHQMRNSELRDTPVDGDCLSGH